MFFKLLLKLTQLKFYLKDFVPCENHHKNSTLKFTILRLWTLCILLLLNVIKVIFIMQFHALHSQCIALQIRKRICLLSISTKSIFLYYFPELRSLSIKNYSLLSPDILRHFIECLICCKMSKMFYISITSKQKKSRLKLS